MANTGLWITPDDLDADVRATPFAQEACETASFMLWGMSGRKFSGRMEMKERHLVPELHGLTGYEAQSYLASTAFQSIPYNFYLMRPQDINKNRIYLRSRPVHKIISIVDVATGETVDPDTYQLWDGRYIEFSDTVNIDVDVTYDYGVMPPTAGKMAARHLATQFALLWGGREDECSLPDRVTNVTRQNVSWVLLDNQDFIDDLRTGVYTVDLFLKTVNPNGATQRSRVFSPDIRRGRRNTI